MNKADLAAHVAAQVALHKIAADRTVSAVFAAIGDALARDEAVAIAGFGTFSTPLAPRASGAEPANGREHRHRHHQGAGVQGREEAPRYRKRS